MHGAALICSSHHPQELVHMVDHCLLIQHGRLVRYDINPLDASDDGDRAWLR